MAGSLLATVLDDLRTARYGSFIRFDYLIDYGRNGDIVINLLATVDELTRRGRDEPSDLWTN